MKPAPDSLQRLLAVSAFAMLLAALAGLGFALWMENGVAMFISLAQAGLAWCL
ncbi:hypothetical protein [Chelativorans intermedius]|uniref:Uncharacterized protein n=1 Tax=Chelativorans intermedius TaxID=515947 RepID=A0ABV6D3H2_9HYPH|nr:hypothetical protein [Chelativorans intermedius]MCT8996893.1 hypothetical protein [Chelativorans intermedius]